MRVDRDWRMVKKVLCVRLDTLGDVLMTTPAIRALKESIPGCQITLMSSKSGTEIAPMIPEIDDCILYEAPWMKATKKREISEVDRKLISMLKRKKYDAAVIFTVYSQNPLASAYLCYLAEIPLRLAYCRENPYQLITNWVRETEPQAEIKPEAQRHLDLVKSIGAAVKTKKFRIAIPQQFYFSIISILNRYKLDIHRPWIVIHPGATAPSRRYPGEYFAEVARRLVLEDNLQVVFTGVRSEKELVQRIQIMAGVESVSLAGKLSLEEMAALIDLAPLLLSNNTGPVHLAAAVGTPVVDLYALTNPQHTPWCVPNRVLFHDVPCKYCYKSVCPEGHHNCLRLVSPDMVIQAVHELWEETRSDRNKQGFVETVME